MGTSSRQEPTRSQWMGATTPSSTPPLDRVWRVNIQDAAALGLIGELGVGTATASALQLALALAGLFGAVGLLAMFTGAGLV